MQNVVWVQDPPPKTYTGQTEENRNLFITQNFSVAVAMIKKNFNLKSTPAFPRIYCSCLDSELVVVSVLSSFSSDFSGFKIFEAASTMSSSSGNSDN
jgi:hypothetical protein